MEELHIVTDGEIEELEIQKVTKEDIDTFYKKKSKRNIIHINKEYFDNERFKDLIENNANIKSIWLSIDEDMISEENIQLLRDKLINCSINSKQISSNRIFGYHTLEEVQNNNNFRLLFFKEEYLDHLKYLPNGAYLDIRDYGDIDQNINLYIKIINKLESLGIEATVEIDENIISNIKLKESGIPYTNFKYVNITIFRDGLHYTLQEYLEEDKKLEDLILEIKDSNLSPFEKYLAIYNIVKQFKPYKENNSGYINYLVEQGLEENEALEFASDSNNKQYYDKWLGENNLIDNSREESRYLKYILNNDYMVCVGYAKLFIDLLERVGISADYLNVRVDTSYDKGFTMEEKPVKFGGHARVIVNLVDEKYGIDGYYIADPTWDNNMEIDLYNHAIMTIEETTLERRLQKIQDLDYLLDVHSMEEFNIKLNALIDKKCQEYLNHEKKSKQNTNLKDDDTLEENIFILSLPTDDLNNSYKQNAQEKEKNLKTVLHYILIEMLKLFRGIDYNKYIDFRKKFGEEIPKKSTPQDYYEAFTDFGNYILTKTNKTISGDTILLAVSVVRNNGVKTQISEKLRKTQIEYQSKEFPKIEINSDNLGTIIQNEENKFESKRR